jgi:hypothetical protein
VVFGRIGSIDPVVGGVSHSLPERLLQNVVASNVRSSIRSARGRNSQAADLAARRRLAIDLLIRRPGTQQADLVCGDMGAVLKRGVNRSFGRKCARISRPANQFGPVHPYFGILGNDRPASGMSDCGLTTAGPERLRPMSYITA